MFRLSVPKKYSKEEGAMCSHHWIALWLPYNESTGDDSSTKIEILKFWRELFIMCELITSCELTYSFVGPEQIDQRTIS
jgi:hypothetical protein